MGRIGLQPESFTDVGKIGIFVVFFFFNKRLQTVEHWRSHPLARPSLSPAVLLALKSHALLKGVATGNRVTGP